MMCLWQSAATIPVTSYANSGGTGDRTASITVATGGGFTSQIFTGAVSNLVDGAFAANGTDSINMDGGGSHTTFTDGSYVEFAFASSVYIDEAKLYMDRAISWGTWKFQYWDGAAFQDLNSFTWNTQTQTQTVTGMPANGTTKFRITKSGTASGLTALWFEEVEFKIAPGA